MKGKKSFYGTTQRILHIYKLQARGQKGSQAVAVSNLQPKMKFEVLYWKGTHFTFKLNQESFKKGYLNIWLEYSNINEDFVRRHTEGFISGLKLLFIRNMEAGMSGTNVIYEIEPKFHASIPDVDASIGESVLGIQDCDFSCEMKVGFRPKLDSIDGIEVLFGWEI